MKSIKEKQLLVKWSQAMNEPVDAAIVEEVKRYERIKQDILISVKQNTLNDLKEASLVADEVVEKVRSYPKPPTVDELMQVLKEEQHELVQAQAPQKPTIQEDTRTLADRAAEHLTQEARLEEKVDSFQQPNPASVDKNLNAIQKKLKFLEQAIGKIAATGPGSGSYWLYDLGDTNYNIVKTPSNNDVLTYKSANSKWEIGTVSNLLGTRYHGSYFSNVSQIATSTLTSYFITVNNTDFQNGFTTDGANLIAQFNGVYNLQFSNQIHYNGGGGSGKTIEIWLTKNGADILDTNTKVDIQSASPYVVAAWNFLVQMNAGDKVALKWATDNLSMGFDASLGRLGPNIPSVILTISQI